ncbi:hexosephosphate transport protein [Salmonella enterica subsp. enterica]|uniref:Hexosephosphate transport protein n=1 Tax=Salmonella enterica I TaxID=59201 RepID=A0A447P3I4_SALET|nr:hexosephosphate transport protein [Salmonella enterica subsp. enterica]
MKNKVIWLLCFSNIFLYVVRIGIDQWSTVYAFQELKLSKEVAIQGFTLFEVGALVGTLLWGWLSDLANGRPRAGSLCGAGVNHRHPPASTSTPATSMSIWPRCSRSVSWCLGRSY